MWNFCALISVMQGQIKTFVVELAEQLNTSSNKKTKFTFDTTKMYELTDSMPYQVFSSLC